GNVSDTRIAESWPSRNYGSEPVAFAGRVGRRGRLMLLRFNLDAVPAGARITKATITLHRQTCGCTHVGAHLVTAAWSEQDVTWGSFGNAYEPEPLAILPEGVNTDGDYGAVSFDATEAVRAWHTDAETNNGLVLAQEHTNTSFATSEAPAVEERPRLDIYF